MQLRPAYPVDTATGACFVTGKADPSEGVVDLDTDLDTLPPWGRLCVSATAVRSMVTCLGWILPSRDLLEENEALLEENNELAAENRRLREAVRRLIDVAELAKLVRVAELADMPELEVVG